MSDLAPTLQSSFYGVVGAMNVAGNQTPANAQTLQADAGLQHDPRAPLIFYEYAAAPDEVLVIRAQTRIMAIVFDTPAAAVQALAPAQICIGKTFPGGTMWAKAFGAADVSAIAAQANSNFQNFIDTTFKVVGSGESLVFGFVGSGVVLTDIDVSDENHNVGCLVRSFRNLSGGQLQAARNAWGGPVSR